MEKTIKAVSVSFGVAVFFIMAIVAWTNDCSPPTACWRAFIGFVIAYVIASIACRIVIKVVVDEIIDSQVHKYENKNQDNS